MSDDKKIGRITQLSSTPPRMVIRNDVAMVSKSELEELRATITRQAAEIERLRGALDHYGVHDNACVLYQCQAGRPTDDGGYEVMYGDKWYSTRPVDNKPKCQCGLDDARSLSSTLTGE